MKPLISIVIPVYNVQSYLKDCLDSLVNQTYKNLQIIIVDDGSTDNSGKICDEYASSDNRITVIHQKNKGAGAAKNSGLELIKGVYFSMIDSDDYIELNTYEKMLDYMEQNSVDIVQYQYRKKYVDGIVNQENSCINGPQKISSKRYLQEMLSDWRYALFWNKLYKTELLSDTRFPDGRKIDDEFFTYKLICNADYILNVEDVCYNYRIRKTSVMNDSKEDRLISDRIDCFVERYHIVKEMYPSLQKLFYRHLSEILIIFKGKANSEELKTKIEENMKLFPYKRPSVIEIASNKLNLHKVSKNKNDVCNHTNTDSQNYQLYD